MKLIIPMAGRGTRLRPHTHVTPKPLMSVVGVSMIERLVDTFISVLPRKLEESVFILGPDFPKQVYDDLTAICDKHDVKASFAVQDKPLGTGHAVNAAKEFLDGEIIIVFADTLFFMEPGVDLDSADVVMWTKWVEDPRRFGVAVKDGDVITKLVEKPEEIISNEALIGIYYVKDGNKIREAIKYMLDEDMTGVGGEYFLTDAFDVLLQRGLVFKTAGVTDWLDCGTIPALKETSWFLLNKNPNGKEAQKRAENSIIIDPVFIDEGATIKNSIVGPNVVVEKESVIEGSILEETIVYTGAKIENSNLNDSVIGRYAHVNGQSRSLNIGDHAEAS